MEYLKRGFGLWGIFFEIFPWLLIILCLLHTLLPFLVECLYFPSMSFTFSCPSLYICWKTKSYAWSTWEVLPERWAERQQVSVSIQSFGSVFAIVFSSWGLKDSRKYSSIFPFLVKKQATFPHNIYSAFIVIISNNYFFLLAHCFSSIAICSCFNTTGFSQLSLMLWVFFLSSLISALFFFWEFYMISQIYSLPWSSDTFHIICVLCLLMAMNDGLTSHCS